MLVGPEDARDGKRSDRARPCTAAETALKAYVLFTPGVFLPDDFAAISEDSGTSRLERGLPEGLGRRGTTRARLPNCAGGGGLVVRMGCCQHLLASLKQEDF